VRVPLAWLREYVDIELGAHALREELTVRGMEVTAVEVSGAEWSDVVVGRLLEVSRHPNADTLWVTTVLTREGGEPLEIVCGAQNVAPGQLVPVAVAGATLPGNRQITRTKIRGVVSNGMLCSARELDLGADADGILILGTDEEHPLGTDLRSIYGDVVLDVDVKPNRGDALSMVGLAREVAAFSRAALRKPSAALVEGDEVASNHVSVTIEDELLCPRFTGRWFSEVSNGPSPDWMQRRLVAAGMRPISAVVDVTNYVMHELGQPMHAYDADTIPQGRIVVRRARSGEVLETIDHEQRALDERMLVIADETQPIGLAGIMGGAATEVTAETTRVILESAVFHGPTIRNTARRLGLQSEASMRHEKGISWDVPRYAANRAAQLIAEITGASVASGIVDNDPDPKPLRVVRGEVARTERLLGIPLSVPRIRELLRPLDFEVVDPEPGSWEVTVPPHRLDVVEAADVAEEIARAHGYPLIPGRLPVAALPPYRADPSEPRQRVRRILAGLGLSEVVTHALIAPEDLRRSGYGADESGIVRVANPLSEAHVLLRPQLYPSILASLAENVRQRRLDPWIFEIGKTYHYGPDARRPPLGAETAGKGRFEVWHLSIGLLGPETPPALGTESRAADVAQLKGVIDALHAALGAPPPTYRAESSEERHPHLHPGRAGRLVGPSGHDYGSLGEIDPGIAAKWGIPGRPVVAAINLPQLFALVPDTLRVAPVPGSQPIDRDLAVVLDQTTPVGELLRLIRANAGQTLVEARLFDEYRGEQVGAGRVSYAVALRFQPETAGDDKAIEKALNRVRGALMHHLGAEIR
jgi:phenylalanyl-tRNA synthetase beta chain